MNTAFTITLLGRFFSLLSFYFIYLEEDKNTIGVISILIAGIGLINFFINEPGIDVWVSKKIFKEAKSISCVVYKFLRFRLITGPIMLLISTLYIYSFSTYQLTYIQFTGLLLYTFLLCIDFSSVLKGAGKLKIISVGIFISSLSGLILIFILIKFKINQNIYIVYIIFTTIIISIYSIIYIYILKFKYKKFAFSFVEIIKEIKSQFFLGVIGNTGNFLFQFLTLNKGGPQLAADLRLLFTLIAPLDIFKSVLTFHLFKKEFSDSNKGLNFSISFFKLFLLVFILALFSLIYSLNIDNIITYYYDIEFLQKYKTAITHAYLFYIPAIISVIAMIMSTKLIAYNQGICTVYAALISYIIGLNLFYIIDNINLLHIIFINFLIISLYSILCYLFIKKLVKSRHFCQL